MCCSGLRPNNITSPQTLRNPTLVANPTVPRNDSDKLAFLVSVPVCASTRRECNIRNGRIGVKMDRIEEDVACEGLGRLDALGGFIVAASDDN